MTCLMADPRAGQGIEKSCRDLHWITLRSSTAVVLKTSTQIITDDVADTLGWLDVRGCSQLLLGINFTKGNLGGLRIYTHCDDHLKEGVTHAGNALAIFNSTADSGLVIPLYIDFYQVATIKTCIVVRNPGVKAISFFIVGIGADNTNSQLQLYVMRSGMNSPVVQV